MTRSSNQSVAGQPVAACDSMPMHQGLVADLSALILSVRALSSSMVWGALYPALSHAFFGYQTKLLVLALTSRPYSLPLTVPASRVPGSMLDLSEFMSTTSSSAVALFRLTMSATTPGCGMNEMSGTSFAWILVMMTWLMLSTFCQFTVTPAACASGSSPAFRPSMTGLSMLAQIVTVDPLTSPWGLLPPPDEELEPPELRQADVSAMVAPS